MTAIRIRSEWPARLVVSLLAVSAAGAAEVALVQGRGDRGPYIRAVEAGLAQAGIEFDRLNLLDPAPEVLSAYRLMVLPYFSQATAQETEAVRSFVEKGGKLMAFYRLPVELCELLGISLGPFLQDTPTHPFYAVRFAQGEVVGLPERMIQESWSIFTAYPVGGARVVGGWCSADGQDSGHAAVFMNENGCFMNHVLTADDVRAKSDFLLAMVGRFLPQQWERSARKALGDFGKTQAFTSVEELQALIRARGGGQGLPPQTVEKAEKCVSQALATRQEAEGLCTQGKYAESFRQARTASDLLRSAYYLLFRSREEELRGVFIPSPNPAPNWETVCRQLRACGFNALFPYVGSAGMAHYRSALVPRSPLVTHEATDPLQTCVRAAHQAGLSVHAWENLFNVSDASEGFRSQMESSRRLVPGLTGEASHFLCPTQPVNRAHVLEVCAELARSHELDGLFLDYLRYPFRPGSRFCLCPVCRAAFERDSGLQVTTWPADVVDGALAQRFNEWQQRQLTDWLLELRARLRELRPKLIVSVAVFGWPMARKNVGQDLLGWIDRGCVDMPILMNYTDSASFFEQLTKQETEEIRGRVPWCTAIGAFSHAAQFASPIPLIDQIELTRKHGASGFVIFRLNYTLLNEFLPALRQGITATQAKHPKTLP